MLMDIASLLCLRICHTHNRIPTPTAVPSRRLAPTLNAEGHDAMNPNLLPAANPASLFASSVFTTPIWPVRVPKPIVPDLGGGADVTAMAGPSIIGIPPMIPPPPAGAAAGVATSGGVAVSAVGANGVFAGVWTTWGVAVSAVGANCAVDCV